MLTFLVIYLLVFINVPLVLQSAELFTTPNVKTALYTELDLRRSCWNAEDTSVLRARMIMQDLVPKKVPRDMAYLVEYIRSTEEAVVHHSPEGKVRRVMMLALSDVMGGYLQAVAIPMAKEAYYAGNIDYATMARLYEHLNEMKSRLRTDGGRWSRPVDMSKFSVKVTALHLSMENSELACKAMTVTPKENSAPGMSRIAIPYLDYDHKPGAVALPLKSRNLYSLKTAASSHIIVRFYMLSRQCLSEMPASDTQVFNYQFVKWLTTKVVPHLQEDTWYPGFGSVMRIIETVNETEILKSRKSQIYKPQDSSLEKSLTEGKSFGIVENVKIMAKYNLWLFLLAALILILLLLCCGCFCFVCFSRKNGKFFSRSRESGVVNAVLSIYCGFKDKNDPQKSKLIDQEGRRDSQDSSRRAYPISQQQKRYVESESSSVSYSSDEDQSTTSSV